MNDERMDITAALPYLVRRLSEEHRGKQIGKTVVQKLMYFISREPAVNTDIVYSMYHYGPYSSQVSGELAQAEADGFLEISWIPERGYSISAAPEAHDDRLTPAERAAIDSVVARFGRYDAVSLSIIATGDFVRDRYGVQDPEELSRIVHSLKPKYAPEVIREMLAEAGVVA